MPYTNTLLHLETNDIIIIIIIIITCDDSLEEDETPDRRHSDCTADGDESHHLEGGPSVCMR